MAGFLSFGSFLWCMCCIKLTCVWWCFCFPRHQGGCRLFLASNCVVSASGLLSETKKDSVLEICDDGGLLLWCLPRGFHSLLCRLCNKSIKLQFAIRTLVILIILAIMFAIPIYYILIYFFKGKTFSFKLEPHGLSNIMEYLFIYEKQLLFFQTSSSAWVCHNTDCKRLSWRVRRVLVKDSVEKTCQSSLLSQSQRRAVPPASVPVSIPAFRVSPFPFRWICVLYLL